MNSDILKISEADLEESLVDMLLKSAEESKRAFQRTGYLRSLRESIDYGLVILAKYPEHPQARDILMEGIPEYLRCGGSKKNEQFRTHIATLYNKLSIGQVQIWPL